MKFSRLLPIAYCGIAVVTWLSFMLLPPDGLANLGLMLLILPVTMLDLALRPDGAAGESVFLPDSLGYYAGHTVYFVLAVALVAAGLWWIGRFLDRALRR